MFRLMDDYASHVASRSTGLSPAFSNGLRTFQPRFDVKENTDSYELQGELPGMTPGEVEINFTDANTLSIKGRTERVREEGTRPTGAIEAQPEQSEQPAITPSEGNSYHKATVEDEGNPTNTASTAESTPQATPAESSVAENAGEAASQSSNAEKSRYWISERSVGQFARTFAFPSRVDQENVKASLKNGILSIVVPKAAAPQNKRINIE